MFDLKIKFKKYFLIRLPIFSFFMFLFSYFLLNFSRNVITILQFVTQFYFSYHIPIICSSISSLYLKKVDFLFKFHNNSRNARLCSPREALYIYLFILYLTETNSIFISFKLYYCHQN